MIRFRDKTGKLTTDGRKIKTAAYSTGRKIYGKEKKKVIRRFLDNKRKPKKQKPRKQPKEQADISPVFGWFVTPLDQARGDITKRQAYAMVELSSRNAYRQKIGIETGEAIPIKLPRMSRVGYKKITQKDIQGFATKKGMGKVKYTGVIVVKKSRKWIKNNKDKNPLLKAKREYLNRKAETELKRESAKTKRFYSKRS